MRRGTRAELRAVLFTDVVGSTQIARELGDQGWGELLRRERILIRDALKRFGGREVDTAGDGLFALFESPASAVRCAFESTVDVQRLGLDIRAGVHVGEIETDGRGAHGIVVHTGARVMSEAGPAQVVITGTVKDLVAGARIEVEGRGEYELKGVQGKWALFDVVRVEDRPRPEPLSEPEGESRRTAVPPPAKRRRVRSIVALSVLAAAIAAVVAIVLLASHRPTYIPGANTVARIDVGRAAFDRPIAVGAYPTGLAATDGRIWVIDQRDQTVDRIDPTTGEVTSRGTPGVPTGIAAGAGAVWVTNAFGTGSGSATPVTRLDPKSLQITRPFDAPTGSAAIAAGAGAIWVADAFGGRLVRFDPVTASIEKIPLSAGVPGTVQPSFVAVGGPPSEDVWVADSLGSAVYRLDPAHPAAPALVAKIGADPTALAASASALWVTSAQSNQLFELDASSGRTTATVHLAGAACTGPSSVVVSRGDVWVACAVSHAVVELDATSRSVVRRLTVDGSPSALTVDDQGNVWVAVHSA